MNLKVFGKKRDFFNIIQRPLLFTLDVFFPRFCLECGRWGRYICQKCRLQVKSISVAICPYCAKNTPDGYTHPLCGNLETRLDGLKSLFYYSPPIPTILKNLKYRLVRQITKEIDLLIKGSSADILDYTSDRCIIVPMPLHRLRENSRGFNQASIIASLIKENTGLGLETVLLKRVKNTPPQAQTKSREKRLTNLAGAFAVNRALVEKYRNTTILLIDDVWTSGATMKEAARSLKKAGFRRVLALTLAH